MKDYIWVVEVKSGDDWNAMDAEPNREGARFMAMWRRACGFRARIRKYVRAQS